jgi:hypothetical protein
LLKVASTFGNKRPQYLSTRSLTSSVKSFMKMALPLEKAFLNQLITSFTQG